MFRLLIVEDEENSRKGLKATLAPIPNLEIDTACDGREGCLKAIRWNPDIIISDIHMPVWDGLVMTEKLCKKGFAGTIYLLTGYAEFEYARKALQYHVEDYILKPVVPSKLRNLIEVKLKDLNKKETARIPSYAISYPMKIRCFSRNAWLPSAIRITFWPWFIWNGNTIFPWRSRKLS